MRLSNWRRWFGTAAAVGLAAGSAPAQNYYWNNTGTDWGTGANWTNITSGTTGTVPVAANGVVFGATTTTGSIIPGSPIDPNLSADQAALQVIFAPNANAGGWNITSATANNLVIGGTGSLGITAYGPATYTVNGPVLAGSSATNTLAFNVANGSSLVLSGTTAVTANLGNTVSPGARFN